MIPEYTKRAIKNYQKKIKGINIPFNLEKEEDIVIYNYLSTVNKTALIKKLLLEHIKIEKINS